MVVFSERDFQQKPNMVMAHDVGTEVNINENNWLQKTYVYAVFISLGIFDIVLMLMTPNNFDCRKKEYPHSSKCSWRSVVTCYLIV